MKTTDNFFCTKDKFTEIKGVKTIVRDMQEIRALNDKIKSLCMKADLDLTESSFIANQKNQILLWTETNNRIEVIKNLICGTANPTRNETVSIPEIVSSKLQCVTFSAINPSKFEYMNILAQFENCTRIVKCQKVDSSGR